MATFVSKEGKLYIDDHEVLKGWESFSGWYWFATEITETQDSLIDGETYYNDTIYFGYVQGSYEEWGSFSEGQLKSLGPLVWEIPYRNLPWSGRRNNRLLPE